MLNIILISGLGADKRVFDYLKLNSVNIQFIDWIKPHYNESLRDYTQRLAKTVVLENPIILGVSFGGIIAVEMSKIISCNKVIIVSSIKSIDEEPILLKFLKFFKLSYITKLLPLRYNFILRYFFGIKNNDDSNLLKRIINESDSKFVKWALKSILTYSIKDYPKNIIHLHGENDRIFPIRRIFNPIILKNSGHFAIVEKANEISVILNQILKEIE